MSQTDFFFHGVQLGNVTRPSKGTNALSAAATARP